MSRWVCEQGQGLQLIVVKKVSRGATSFLVNQSFESCVVAREVLRETFEATARPHTELFLHPDDSPLVNNTIAQLWKGLLPVSTAAVESLVCISRGPQGTQGPPQGPSDGQAQGLPPAEGQAQGPSEGQEQGPSEGPTDARKHRAASHACTSLDSTEGSLSAQHGSDSACTVALPVPVRVWVSLPARGYVICWATLQLVISTVPTGQTSHTIIHLRPLSGDSLRPFATGPAESVEGITLAAATVSATAVAAAEVTAAALGDELPYPHPSSLLTAVSTNTRGSTSHSYCLPAVSPLFSEVTRRPLS